MASSPIAEPASVPERETSARKLAAAVPLTYGTIIVCFLFTFLNISCQGQRVASLSGLQLSFGTTVERQTMLGGMEKKKVPAEPLVAGAFFAAVAGLILSVGRIGRRKASAVVGGVGFVLLLFYKSKTDGDVLRQGAGLIQVDYGGGFILAVTLFAVATLLASGFADRTILRLGSSVRNHERHRDV